ncbi:hydrogenase 4 subunit F [Azospirillum halopraeferens]|uniref:hydrogenase 4 subunit F n=1 Tax=Azospirillum halopraeferens TaxID=34010 RepID=UPI00042A6C9A|nr:hydrogenase 4 subunit F [Azospirillum halopraeferens]
MALLTLLPVPLIAALVQLTACHFRPLSRRTVEAVHLASIALVLVLSLLTVRGVAVHGPVTALGHWLHVDALGAVFLALIGVVGFLTGLYSIAYMRHDLAHGEVDDRKLGVYYGFFSLFLFTMLLVVTANNIIMMWVAVEATTLGSAFLVALYGKRSSLEAAWKYLVICTVGVAFGLYGTVLVYANVAAAPVGIEGAAFWTVLLQHADVLDPTLAKIAFVFVLVGFGTKAGLFPMHAWLPDAHSEAPSPTSALLSAVLLNCALFIVIRFDILVSKAVGPAFPHMLLLGLGVLSLAVAALFVVVQRDLKRLLAYSSVENMGLIAIALGIGGPLGVMAALLHTVNHSLAKALLFCGSGNILMKYGTRDLDTVKGVLRVAPVSGVLLMAGALALGGMPPFNVFVSEFLTVTAGIDAGYGWLMIVCLVLLTVVLAAFVRMIAGSILGASPPTVAKGDVGPLALAPMAVLLVMMLIMGVRVPAPVAGLLREASAIVLATEGSDALALRMPWQNATTVTLAEPVDAGRPTCSPNALRRTEIEDHACSNRY